jgi:hypothetical protein
MPPSFVSPWFTIPICFADSDASQLLGREGFFDYFRIEFDKPQLLTRFELIAPVA